MNTLIKIVLFLIIFERNNCEKERYDNFEVYRIRPHDRQTVEILRQLEDHQDTFNFWSDVIGVDDDVHIMVPPQFKPQFQKFIDVNKLNSTLFIKNVQELIDREQVATRSTEFDWTSYRTLDEINSWLTSLSKKYPDKVTLLSAGQSYEKRNLTGVKLSFSKKNKNRGVFLEGTIHAREWISGAVVTYILNELLTSTDPHVRAMAESNDWYVFPVVNPDGYVFSHEEERLWRKTRVPYGGRCYGADPNRNWDFHYNEGGTSGYPCSCTYRGPYAFSEPSVKSLSKFLSTIGKQLRGYIGFHSFAQKLLIPYGHTFEHLDNYDDLIRVGRKAIKSLAKRYGTQYLVGTTRKIMYLATGSSMDWVKGNFKTPITYTYELRDTGRCGFLLPPDQIIPTGQETLDSLVTIMEEFDKILPVN